MAFHHKPKTSSTSIYFRFNQEHEAPRTLRQKSEPSTLKPQRKLGRNNKKKHSKPRGVAKTHPEWKGHYTSKIAEELGITLMTVDNYISEKYKTTKFAHKSKDKRLLSSSARAD